MGYEYYPESLANTLRRAWAYTGGSIPLLALRRTSHGSGGTCNYSATVPSYVPDQVVQNGDTVYLLSIANRRVSRCTACFGALGATRSHVVFTKTLSSVIARTGTRQSCCTAR